MNYTLPEFREIPDVGLYLKQVVSFINTYVGEPLGFSVTDTMLSNYVKRHMIPSPVKKLYYRDHIAMLVYIAMAKSVLTLENLEKQLAVIRGNGSTAAFYDGFKRCFDCTYNCITAGEIKETVSDITKMTYGITESAGDMKAGAEIENGNCRGAAGISEEARLLEMVVTAMSYQFCLELYFQEKISALILAEC